VREALGVAGCVQEAFVTREALERHEDVATVLSASGIAMHVCDDLAIGSLAGSVSPQGIIAVCRFVDLSLEEALAGQPRLVTIAAHVRDPGNLGTMVRCADAAGADAVVLAGSSVDPYNDKVVRASVGSLFHLPLVVGTTLATTVAALHARDFRVMAAAGAAEQSLDALLATGALSGRVAWVFGNEAWGLPAEDRALCDREVAVPIYGRAESLNVATAAAVCLYATAWAQRG
jgi:TrmH family RNA methyltransferase